MRNILVATDTKTSFEPMLGSALKLAEPSGTNLHVLKPEDKEQAESLKPLGFKLCASIRAEIQKV